MCLFSAILNGTAFERISVSHVMSMFSQKPYFLLSDPITNMLKYKFQSLKYNLVQQVSKGDYHFFIS